MNAASWFCAQPGFHSPAPAAKETAEPQYRISESWNPATRKWDEVRTPIVSADELAVRLGGFPKGKRK